MGGRGESYTRISLPIWIMYKQDGVRIGVNVLVDLSAELLTPVNSFAEMSLTAEIFVFF
jgi:hypothetical protein